MIEKGETSATTSGPECGSITGKDRDPLHSQPRRSPPGAKPDGRVTCLLCVGQHIRVPPPLCESEERWTAIPKARQPSDTIL